MKICWKIKNKLISSSKWPPLDKRRFQNWARFLWVRYNGKPEDFKDYYFCRSSFAAIRTSGVWEEANNSRIYKVDTIWGLARILDISEWVQELGGWIQWTTSAETHFLVTFASNSIYNRGFEKLRFRIRVFNQFFLWM